MNRGNICPADSSTSNERDKSREYQYNSENPLSDICKYLDIPTNKKTSSSENVELALEVEINESLKEVLERDSSGSSDLLDVTIIRPSESDTTHETTVALNKDEVRDFISLVEQHHKNKKTEATTRSSARPRDRKFRDESSAREKSHSRESDSTKKKNSRHFSSKSSSPRRHKISDEQKQVYTTVNNFDSKLKEALTCQNKQRSIDQKPGTPCLCQHCGIVGVLVQSQKGPVAAFPSITEETSDYSQKSGRSVPSNATKDTHHRTVDLRRKKSTDRMSLLREINARIKALEQRIGAQEKTAVSKDYLKHILQKIINFKSAASSRETSIPTTKFRNNTTQYSLRSSPQRETRHQCGHKQYCNAETSRSCREKNIHVNTCLQTPEYPCLSNLNGVGDGTKTVENDDEVDVDELNLVVTKSSQVKPSNTSLKASPSKDNEQVKDLFWFWGEEIVRPGCDLRNKILNLLEDKVHRNNASKNTETTKTNNDEHTFQYPSSLPKNLTLSNPDDIKVERDNNTIFLNNVEQMELFNTNHIKQKEMPYLIANEVEEVPKRNKVETLKAKPAADDKCNRTVRDLLSKRCNYNFDVKKTLDDSTFRKNIEACKKKFRVKEKPTVQVDEKYFNTYAFLGNRNVEAVATTEHAAQRNNYKIKQSGVTGEREEFNNEKLMLPRFETAKNEKDKLDHNPRYRLTSRPQDKPISFTYVSPKINNWSCESSQSEDKFLASRRPNLAAAKKDKKCADKEESLRYKLDFLKNLAKHKSIDQSRVLNRIWNQAKTTAKSNKDAVFIKIPIKTINACDAKSNIVEMELTLEELETAVKTVRNPRRNQAPAKLGYRSSSEVDVGQRRHEEMKRANREILRRSRRQGSAKSKMQR